MIISSSLPLSWYFDPQIFEIEQRTILASAPKYIGCAATIPVHGSFHTVASRGHAEVLVRDRDQIHLLSNTCCHRHSRIVHGTGTSSSLTCPLHGWSYDLAGQLLAAPSHENAPCLRLPNQRIQDWNGLLFSGARDIASDLAVLGPRSDLDIRHYRHVMAEEQMQAVNWKIPIEIGLENYHAPFIHPGFARYTPSSTWFQNEGTIENELVSFQQMKPHSDFAHNPASPAFDEMQRAILAINGGNAPPYGVVILIYYPNTFFEWWPYAFEATTYTPLAVDRTLMTREILFDPAAMEVVPDFPDLFMAAWFETQIADDEAQVGIQRGRAALYQQTPDGASGYGIFQSMEEGITVFLALVRNAVLPNLTE